MLANVHHMDRKDLLGWRADVDNPAFVTEYENIRRVYEQHNACNGGLDHSTLLSLAVKYQRVVKPVEEKPALEPSLNSKPKKVLQPA